MSRRRDKNKRLRKRQRIRRIMKRLKHYHPDWTNAELEVAAHNIRRNEDRERAQR